jgi:hypothetical protein
MSDCSKAVTPKIVFIVPYRDRKLQLDFFNRHMKYIMEDVPKEQYRILIVHQCDTRSFNRGALKNIGFHIVRDLYPETYQNITLVFNDLDTLPYVKNFLPYDTVPGVVKHFYGVHFTLGGIFSIKAGDFERVNGFPNFWAWGYEDNLLNTRVKNAGIVIDRSVFYNMHDVNMMHMSDGVKRDVNRAEFDRYAKKTIEGSNSIFHLKYTIKNNNIVDVTQFHTGVNENMNERKVHHLANGKIPFRPSRHKHNLVL